MKFQRVFLQIKLKALSFLVTIFSTLSLIAILFFSETNMAFANQWPKIEINEPEWVLALKEEAKKGNATSQVSLGEVYRGRVCLTDETGFHICLYDNTPGIRIDHFEAVNWFQQAAEQGDPKGQTELAFMYNYGFGVRQDYLKALKWLRLAAEQDYGDAQVEIGAMYDEGRGVHQDRTIAKEWYGKACDNKKETGCHLYKRLNEKER